MKKVLPRVNQTFKRGTLKKQEPKFPFWKVSLSVLCDVTFKLNHNFFRCSFSSTILQQFQLNNGVSQSS